MDGTGFLDVEVRDEARVRVVGLSGELDRIACYEVRELLLGLAVERPRAIIVELGEIKVVSPALLVVFDVVAAETAEWPGVPVLLVITSTPVRMIFAAAGLPERVLACQSMAEAMAALDTGPRARRLRLPVPASPSGELLARAAAEQVCHSWRLPGLTQVLPPVAADLIAHIAAERGECVTLQFWTDVQRMVVSVRGLLRGEAALAVPAWRDTVSGHTPTGDGGVVVWTSLGLACVKD
ncbi:STAS domain-containing protein [Crossiella cryophila]|uniref:Anti-anti-sigma regulatory factor n=1 Tax=Crossiella cryophila TaxID=43355 RepID=A0A7W7CDC6_9PSEU|nr:STAS domain-containing protein [Crossiella cryophila]MBB4678962.1 anti-anti-sigma regulatory factor [Crossiella cryophila]